MAEIVRSGLIADIIIALMLIEAMALHVYNRMTGSGISLSLMIGNVFAGICLLLALRAALTGLDWWWIAFWLAASLAGHLMDLRTRWHQAD